MTQIYSPLFNANDENDFKNQFYNLSHEKKENLFLHESTLISLVENNHPNLVKFLIEQGMNINHYCDKDFKVTTFMAIMDTYWKHKDLIYFFVEKKVNLNLQDCDNKTAIYRAIPDMDIAQKHNQNDIIFYLLSQPLVDLDIKTYRDDTYLKRAIHFGETELALFLIQLGCDLNDHQIIECVCEKNDVEVLKQLILHQVPNSDSKEVLRAFPELQEFMEDLNLRNKIKSKFPPYI